MKMKQTVIQDTVNKLQNRLTVFCEMVKTENDITFAECQEIEYLKEQIAELEIARVKEYRFNEKLGG
jgi:hypothetical protein